MEKKVVSINESALREIVSKSITRALKESSGDSPLFHEYSQMIDACIDIIFRTEKKGRLFSGSAIGELQNDAQFMSLRSELLGCMQAYFDSAKQLLSYIAGKCKDEGEDYLLGQANKFLSKEFTPEW